MQYVFNVHLNYNKTKMLSHNSNIYAGPMNVTFIVMMFQTDEQFDDHAMITLRTINVICGR